MMELVMLIGFHFRIYRTFTRKLLVNSAVHSRVSSKPKKKALLRDMLTVDILTDLLEEERDAGLGNGVRLQSFG